MTDQILYNLTRRAPERELLPWLSDNRMSAMAYSPVEQGQLLEEPDVAAIGRDVGCTASQLALAWVLRSQGVMAIPKAGDVVHVEENRAAADLALSADVLRRLDAAFPAPTGRVPLEML